MLIKIPVEGFPRQACMSCGNPLPKITTADLATNVLCCQVRYDIAHEPIHNIWMWREVNNYGRPR